MSSPRDDGPAPGRGDEDDPEQHDDEERELDRDPENESIPAGFERAVDEGHKRTTRTWPQLLSTGLVGGLDVGVGALALLLIRDATGSELVAAFGLGIGFIALTLGNSELFTENFLVPVASLVAGTATWWGVVRLWLGTLVANLVGGWLVAALIIDALPSLAPSAIEVSEHYVQAGLGWESFAGGLLGGMVITLMTWLQHSSPSPIAKLTAAVSFAWVLAAGPLNHSIISSIEMFASLRAGAPFGYGDWAGFAAWAVLANIVGGVGLVTTLRLVQVGRQEIVQEQHRSRANGTDGDRDG